MMIKKMCFLHFLLSAPEPMETAHVPVQEATMPPPPQPRHITPEERERIEEEMHEIPDVQDELAVPLVLETDLNEICPVLPSLIIPQTSDEMISEGEDDVKCLVAGEAIEAIVR